MRTNHDTAHRLIDGVLLLGTIAVLALASGAGVTVALLLSAAWGVLCTARLRRAATAERSASELLACLDRAVAGEERVRLPRRAAESALARRVRSALRALAGARAESHDLERLVAGTGCGLLVVDGDDRVRSASSTLSAMLGCESATLVGAALSEIIADWHDVSGSIRGASGPVEIDLRRRDGTSLPALITLHARLDPAGRQTSLCAIQEIRGLREVEQRLNRINVRLWLLNEITRIGLGSGDLNTAMQRVADQIQDATGFAGVGIALHDQVQRSLRMIAGSGFDPCTPRAPERADRTGSLLWHVVLQREPMLLQIEGETLDLEDSLLGRVRGVAMSLIPLRAGERLLGVLAVLAGRPPESVDEFKHECAGLAQHLAALVDNLLANEALRRSNEEIELARLAAEEASRAKSEFLANMSHEIRTPMTAILGYADLVRDDGCANEETKEFVAIIRRNGEHLVSIVNDILDLSKIEAGRMTVERCLCSPAQLAREVVEMLSGRAEDKRVRLEFAAEWPLPNRISTDPTRLRQILVNLVGNAVKFTDSGTVCLRVARVERDPRHIEFRVSDTGIGMSATEMAELFRPFSQADTSHTRRFGGTGLGLAISQRLASLLGGSIAVTSQKGCGSTFSLEIDGGDAATRDLDRSGDGPRRALAPSEWVREQERTAEGARVLLAEDGADNQRLISHLLRKAGATVEVVADGRAAVGAVLSMHAEGAAFDLVLMDMQMPVLDGYAATRELREHDYDGLIVALTAHAMSGDRERCLDAGCDAFLTKPIDRTRLLEQVAAAVRRRVSDAAP